MKRMFWVDLEMTGLDETTDHILEVAVVITDMNFKSLEEYHRVVFQPQEILQTMNDWCKKTHSESGLTSAVAKGVPLAQVEKELLELAARHYNITKDKIVITGNSVGNDKRFIMKHMPEFAKLLHYRVIDISSFKEIFRDKYNLSLQKGNAHRAVDDIKESLRELQYYLSFIKLPYTG